MYERNNSKSNKNISTPMIKSVEPNKNFSQNHLQQQAGKSREPSTRKTRQERLGSKYPKQHALDQTNNHREEQYAKQNLFTTNPKHQKINQHQADNEAEKKSQEMGKTTKKINDLYKKRQQVYQYAEPDKEFDEQSTPVKQAFNDSYIVQQNHDNSHNKLIKQGNIEALKQIQEQLLGDILNNYSPDGQNQKLIKKQNSLSQYFQNKQTKNAGSFIQSLELEEQKQGFCPIDFLKGSNNKNAIHSSKNIENESTVVENSHLKNAKKVKPEQPKGLFNSKSYNKIPREDPKQEIYNQMKGDIQNASSKHNESAQLDNQNDGGLLGLQSYKAFKQIRIKNKSFMVNKLQSSQIIPPQSESQNATKKSPFQNNFKQQSYPSFQSLHNRNKELRNLSTNSRFINPRPNNNLSKNRDVSADEFNIMKNNGGMLQNKFIENDLSYEQVSMEILEEEQRIQLAQQKYNHSTNNYHMKKGIPKDLVRNNISYQKQGDAGGEHVHQQITKRASQHQKNAEGFNGQSKVQKSLIEKKSGNFQIATTLSQNLSCMNQLLSPLKLRAKNLQSLSNQNQESTQDLQIGEATGSKQDFPTENANGKLNPKKGTDVPFQLQPRTNSLKTIEIEIDTLSGANQAGYGAQAARGTTKNAAKMFTRCNKSVYSLLKFGLFSPKTPRIEVFKKQNENTSFQALADKKLSDMKNQKLREEKRLLNIKNATLTQKKHKSFAVNITSIEEEKYESNAHLQKQIFQVAQTTQKTNQHTNSYENLQKIIIKSIQLFHSNYFIKPINLIL